MYIWSIYSCKCIFDVLPEQLINYSHSKNSTKSDTFYLSFIHLQIVRVSIKISDRYQITHALKLIRAVLIINTDRMYQLNSLVRAFVYRDG